MPENKASCLKFIAPAKEIKLPVLIKRFTCPANVKSASLMITGLGLYRAYINGERVGDDWLTPGYNDYDAYVRYQTYDVSSLLKADCNTIEIYLGDGWYSGRIGLDRPEGKRWGETLMAAARLTLCDGANETCIDTDETWEAIQSPVCFTDIYDGEIRNDTLETGEPVPCRFVENKWKLVPQFSPAVRARDELRPTLIITPKGESVLDFGQNMAGVVRFVCRAPKGTKIYMQFGEVLQGGCFYRDNLRSAKAEYTYISDGEENTIEPFFTFYGFRYVKVEGLEKVNPDDFTALALSSDLPVTIDAETGHKGINQLMHNTFWGQLSNFVDVPTDCPQRDERLGWTADTQVFVNTACYNMYCKDFYRKFMCDMRYDQLTYCHGDLPPYSPCLKIDNPHGGAVWADAGTIVPWNVYSFYGDEELLKENFPMMKDYVEYLIALDKKEGFTHTVYTTFTFGDWVAQDGLTPQSVFGGTESAFIQGIYYMNSLGLTAKAAAVLGYKEDEEKYASLCEEVRKALQNEYLTPSGRLAVDTQTAYILALRFGLATDEKKLLEGLRRRFRRDFYSIKSGFTGTPLMLPTLFDHGMGDMAYRILLRETFPGWLYCVNLGATTIWERWNSLDENGNITGTGMNSLNHYAYGSVCEAIYSRIIGLKNAAPGWKKAVLAPHPDGRLRFGRIKYKSVSGDWELSWQIEDDGSLSVNAAVPEGCTAEVVLPDKAENARFSVGSGTYQWRYQPTRDYLHPFSADSLMMDLLNNPEAASLIKAELPELYASATEPVNELCVETFRSCTSRADAERRREIAEKLREIKL